MNAGACSAPGFTLHLAQSCARVIILMSINNFGSYLALNNIASHPVWVELQHNYCFFRAIAGPSFPGLIMHSCHIVC